MNIREELKKVQNPASGDGDDFFFHDIEVKPETVRAVLINEVVPCEPSDDFYGGAGAAYLSTAIPMFQKAGVAVNSAEELLERGIYLTNAVKIPKTASAIERCSIEKSLPYLEAELSLFPRLRVVMLMGDVAKKAFNMISKKADGRNAVPAVSTYKIRSSEIWYHGVRVMPSYIMTGQNILIEKSKFEMASEDIAVMYRLIQE